MKWHICISKCPIHIHTPPAFNKPPQYSVTGSCMVENVGVTFYHILNIDGGHEYLVSTESFLNIICRKMFSLKEIIK